MQPSARAGSNSASGHTPVMRSQSTRTAIGPGSVCRPSNTVASRHSMDWPACMFIYLLIKIYLSIH